MTNQQSNGQIGQINRRSLLIGMGSLGISALLAGCNRSRQGAALHLDLLSGSVPPQVLSDFQRQIRDGRGLSVRSVESLDGLYRLLEQRQPSTESSASPDASESSATADERTPDRQSPPTLMSLGDFWLSAAIRQGWIAPLPLSTAAGWDLLPQPWQQMVTRNADGEPDPNGQIWAAPYRYAPLAIAYRADRRDEMGRAPADWADLWNPAIQGRLSLPDSARSVIGLTLKKLGRSVNTDDLNAVSQLRAELNALHAQVRLYSSDAYLQPLLLADTWVAVGWLSDLLPLVRRDPRVAMVIPPAGTLLSADVWVMPTTAPASTQAAEPTENGVDLAQTWIEYCWNLAIATRFSLLGDAPSPVLLGAAAQTNGRANAALPDSVRNNPLLVPPATTLEHSEFLLPLSAPSTEQYQAHWQQMRLPS